MDMNEDDYYKILGVSKDASEKEISKSFRRLAKECHPDKNDSPEATEQFKKIQEAYEILSDSEKRKMYDIHGKKAFSTSQFNGGGFPGFFDMDDIMESMKFPFGNFFSKSSKKSPNIIQYTLDITLEDIIECPTKEITIDTNKKCSSCRGTGGEKTNCSSCNGKGRKRMNMGFVIIEQKCEDCDDGKVLINKCEKCRGSGFITRKTKFVIKIPKFANSGQSIIVENMGHENDDGERTPVYVILNILPHKTFIRNGNDLKCTIKIDMVTACIGGELPITLLCGKKIRLKIPQGTQPNEILTINKRGLNENGKLLCKVKVIIPENLSEKKIKLLKKFQEN